jgi:hypothetical protein
MVVTCRDTRQHRALKDRKVVDIFVLPREDFLAGDVRTIYVQFVVGGASR